MGADRKPNNRKLVIVAQDPSLRVDGRILLTQIDVPAEQLSPGPTGYRVKVVDFDVSTETLYTSAHYQHSDSLGYPEDPFLPWLDTTAPSEVFNHRILSDPHFHAQNTYAIVMRILTRFEFALGRRISWGFGGHQIHVVPHAFADANAFYSENDRGLFFGYFGTEDSLSPVFSCLSHDVIAHESTHAILDGLRDRYTEPSSFDQAGFHEGFSDAVALLSVLAQKDLVVSLLNATRPDESLHSATLIPAALVELEPLKNSVLFKLAEQMGEGLSGVRGTALRHSVLLKPSPEYLSKTGYEAAHARGEILVAALVNTFLGIWHSRVQRLGTIGEGFKDTEYVAMAGARAADHLLTMIVRALDYCPPTDIRYSDFLSALLTSDAEMVPDDSEYDYRRALLESFRSYGIDPRGDAIDGGYCRRFEGELSYSRTHFESLLRDPNEVFRFLWENRENLECSPDAYMEVQSVRPCVRVGPDGFVLKETVAEYVEIMTLEAREAASVLRLKLPAGLAGDQRIRFYGGGVLVFDEYGQLKYHIANRLSDSSRQEERLSCLWKAGYFESEPDERLHFAHLHVSRSLRSEET